MTVLAGCHLIGGAGDLRFEETAGTTTSTGGGAQGAGGDLGGAGGASGCSDCSGPCQSCMSDVCMPLAVTTVCETDGVCDLAGNCAHGDIVWQRLYGDALDDGALAVSSGDGMLHIGGYFTGNNLMMNGVTIGATTMTTDQAIDGFVARIDPATGDGFWAAPLAMAQGTQKVTTLAHRPGGTLALGTEFAYSVSYPPLPLVYNAGPPDTLDIDAYVAVANASSGSALWSWWTALEAAPAAVQRVNAITASDTQLAIAGSSTGSVEWPQGNIYTNAGQFAFVAALTAGGVATMENLDVFACDNAVPRGASFDTTGRLLVAVEYGGFCPGIGGSDVGPIGVGTYLLRYANPDNLSTSSVERIRYSTYDQYLSASKMVLTPDDGWIFAGGVIGSHNLPGGVGLAQTGTGQPDVFVLEADASGDVLWARSFDVTQGAFVKGVARDSAGNVIVVGTLLQGSILKLGEGALELVAQTSGPFIFKLASDGTPLWARLVATAGDDNGEGVTLIGDDIFFAGRATGQLEAGGDPHHGSGDIFVMRLTP